MTEVWIEWSEPEQFGKGPTDWVERICRIRMSDIPRLWRATHPKHTYTDGECISEFIVVHWAVGKEYPV